MTLHNEPAYRHLIIIRNKLDILLMKGLNGSQVVVSFLVVIKQQFEAALKINQKSNYGN